MKTNAILFAAAALAGAWAFSAPAAAQSAHQKHMGAAPAGAQTGNKAGAHSGSLASPYAGQEKQAIKTLSAKDVDDLVNGRGWGFAKAAELNGVPGPAHLLEMKDMIGLSAEQTAAIQKLFAAMKAEAIPLGKQLVALERALNTGFAGRAMNEKRLKTALDGIAKVRAKLRYVHLATHFKTPALLTARQIADYNRLRGYTDAAATPKTKQP